MTIKIPLRCAQKMMRTCKNTGSNLKGLLVAKSEKTLRKKLLTMTHYNSWNKIRIQESISVVKKENSSS